MRVRREVPIPTTGLWFPFFIFIPEKILWALVLELLSLWKSASYSLEKCWWCGLVKCLEPNAQRWEFIKESKRKRKKTRSRPRNRQRKRSRKKESFIIFFLVENRFLSFYFLTVIVFFFSWSLSWSKACFLVFFYKFPPQEILLTIIWELGNFLVRDLITYFRHFSAP